MSKTEDMIREQVDRLDYHVKMVNESLQRVLDRGDAAALKAHLHEVTKTLNETHMAIAAVAGLALGVSEVLSMFGKDLAEVKVKTDA